MSACLYVLASAAQTIFALKRSATETSFGSNYSMMVAPNRTAHIAVQHIAHLMKLLLTRIVFITEAPRNFSFLERYSVLGNAVESGALSVRNMIGAAWPVVFIFVC